MDISRDNRKELDSLSKEVYGTTSRWQKLVNKPYPKLLTEKKTEVVPGENGEPDTTREIDSPILRKDGAHQFVMTYRSLEEVHQIMLTLKAQIEEWKRKIEEAQAKQKEEQEAKAQLEQAQKDLGGSALGGSSV